MKKCKKCGRPMGNNRYCSVCDKALRTAAQKSGKKKTWLIITIALVCVLAVAAVVLLTQCGAQATQTPPKATAASDPSAPLSGKHHVEIEIAGYGTIKLTLDADAAPITVANFLRLANEGFYDGLTFHRIMEGFMMQGGAPEGTGMGGSDETITGEFAQNGINNPLSHTRGAISMARNSFDLNSASSQFFIVQQDSVGLDGQYACFGYVTEGMDVVDAVCANAQPTDDNGTIRAQEQPVITAVRVMD